MLRCQCQSTHKNVLYANGALNQLVIYCPFLFCGQFHEHVRQLTLARSIGQRRVKSQGAIDSLLIRLRHQLQQPIFHQSMDVNSLLFLLSALFVGPFLILLSFPKNFVYLFVHQFLSRSCSGPRNREVVWTTPTCNVFASLHITLSR